MVFSTNQVRQLYVATKIADEVTEKSDTGSIVLKSDKDKKIFYFQYKGADTVLRSDIINPDNLLYVKEISADDATQIRTLKQVTVKLDEDINEGKPISGQDYILRIIINPYVGMSDEEPYFKYGAVHAIKKMTTNTGLFYTKLAVSLFKNFSRELDKMLEFSIAGKVIGAIKHDASGEDVLVDTDGVDIAVAEDYADGITITEIESDWNLGIKEQTAVNFDVIPTTVIYEGDEVTWGEVTKGTSTTTLHNGKKIADLEYFCMGERGDQYRNVGWPNVIPTHYLVDPNQAYNILEIHYAYVGDNEGPQKSEKDIVIVAPKGTTVVSELYTEISPLV